MFVLGADLAPTHAGFVLIDEADEIVDLWYTTTVAGVAKKHRNGYRLGPKAPKDRDLLRMARLALLQQVANEALARRVDLLAVEGYALRQTRGNPYDIGGAGDLVRMLAYHRGIPIREYDPATTRMFICHNGNAPKERAVEDTIRRWKLDLGKFLVGTDENTHDDLADAFAVAVVGMTERKIRAGTLDLADLSHEKERQVFLRTTKTYPVNLLSRPYIERASVCGS